MLKRFAEVRWVLVIVAIVMPAWAQNPPAGMPSQADMQRMMQQGQIMAACMAEIDQSRIEAISREAEAVSDEIDALCKQGDESGALQTAIDFSKKMAADPTVKKLRDCSAGMQDMLAGIMPNIDPAAGADDSGGICD
ncbi:MAG: hypothetical protein HKN56_06320 [Gammaproteobacteria bacterium]|nr:hypothetical protein [Gammaproteobacteria bacterium]NND54568.1 hypothetical protein [Gammaproteobacteria bacterium]